MPVVKRIADYAEDMKKWRRQLHMHPELLFDCHQTAAFVIDRLKEFGVDEIHEKIARTGVVAIINGQGTGNGTTLGLRADMDALPMQETTGLDYASVYDGKMHACGHDGHTTMLLGAARYLAETRHFSGRAVLIFQPAEEGGGGAEVMVKAGILDRFGITEVYALHTSTEARAGQFHTMPGAIMAAVDSFEIAVKGLGGHGACPQKTVDPLVAGVGIVTAIQTIISRNHDPRQDAVCSVTQFHAGTTHNVIAETAFIGGTIRTFDPDDREMILRRLREVAAGQAAAYNCEVEVTIEAGYPATVNDLKKTEFAVAAAREVAGGSAVNGNTGMELGAEDFAFMLEARPGAYLFLNQGKGTGIHNAKFDFNDDVSPYGASFFARIVEMAQPVED